MTANINTRPIQLPAMVPAFRIKRCQRPYRAARANIPATSNTDGTFLHIEIRDADDCDRSGIDLRRGKIIRTT
jgi:hypothetical protein